MIVCAQCAVWRGETEATFADARAALEHAIAVHPNRLAEIFTESLADIPSGSWEQLILYNCRDRIQRGWGFTP